MLTSIPEAFKFYLHHFFAEVSKSIKHIYFSTSLPCCSLVFFFCWNVMYPSNISPLGWVSLRGNSPAVQWPRLCAFTPEGLGSIPGWELRSYKMSCASLLCCVWLFCHPWTVACQAPLSMGFSRQEFWGGLSNPNAFLQGIFPTQGSNPGLLCGGWVLHCLSHQGSPTSWGTQPKTEKKKRERERIIAVFSPLSVFYSSLIN